MKVKTCDLKGIELDFVVAQLEGIDVNEECEMEDEEDSCVLWTWSPSSNWYQAGLIIERENIAITSNSFPWFVTEMGWWGHKENIHTNGPTPQVAAMRCYVQSKLGKEVDMKTVYEALQIEKEWNDEKV